MANDVMIDMETLSTDPDCVILTIGAVRFDPMGTGVVEKLELRPEIDSQTEELNTANMPTSRSGYYSLGNPSNCSDAFGPCNCSDYKKANTKQYRIPALCD